MRVAEGPKNKSGRWRDWCAVRAGTQDEHSRMKSERGPWAGGCVVLLNGAERSDGSGWGGRALIQRAVAHLQMHQVGCDGGQAMAPPTCHGSGLPHQSSCPVNSQNEVSASPMRAHTRCVGSWLQRRSPRVSPRHGRCGAWGTTTPRAEASAAPSTSATAAIVYASQSDLCAGYGLCQAPAGMCRAAQPQNRCKHTGLKEPAGDR